jgi:hypothetical protein
MEEAFAQVTRATSLLLSPLLGDAVERNDAHASREAEQEMMDVVLLGAAEESDRAAEEVERVANRRTVNAAMEEERARRISTSAESPVAAELVRRQSVRAANEAMEAERARRMSDVGMEEHARRQAAQAARAVAAMSEAGSCVPTPGAEPPDLPPPPSRSHRRPAQAHRRPAGGLLSALPFSSQVYSALALLLAVRVAMFVHATGELRVLRDVGTAGCERLHGEHHGYEDFASFDGGLIAFASDHAHFSFEFGTSMRDKLRVRRGPPPRAMGLWGGRWHELKLRGAPIDFAPHGVAGRGPIGPLRRGGRLLVVSHRSTHDTLELFGVRGYTLDHLSTYAHPLLFNVNDCAFETDTTVLCTNWRSYETGTLADGVEVYGQRPWSYVVRCELRNARGRPGGCTKVATGIAMANGIFTRGELVVVVATLEPALLVYRKAPPTKQPDGGVNGDGSGALELLYRVRTRGACDNLMEADGDGLLTACHPRALTFVRHSKAPTQVTAPCEVRRFDGQHAPHTLHATTTHPPRPTPYPGPRHGRWYALMACSTRARRRSSRPRCTWTETARSSAHALSQRMCRGRCGWVRFMTMACCAARCPIE